MEVRTCVTQVLLQARGMTLRGLQRGFPEARSTAEVWHTV